MVGVAAVAAVVVAVFVVWCRMLVLTLRLLADALSDLGEESLGIQPSAQSEGKPVRERESCHESI